MSQGSPSGLVKFIRLLLIAAAVGLLSVSFAVFVTRDDFTDKGPPRGGLGPGQPLPPINAEGWLNGPAPKPESLKGKVLVIDAWAYWCGPCLAEAPHLVAAYQEYHDRGVDFIGLATEPKGNLLDMEKFVRKARIPWPCGYGASETLMALEMGGIPQVWVVRADGTIHWNMDSPGTLNDAIEEALAAAKVVDTPKKSR